MVRSVRSDPTLDESEDWVPALRSGGTVLHFSQDREIYGEGNGAELFFKILSGVVRTCRFLADGRRQVDAFYVAGELFGFETGAHYGLSAEAVSDCTLIAYRRRGLEAAAATDGTVSQGLYLHAMRSLARAQEHSQLLGRRDAAEKVAAFLLQWANPAPDGEVASLAMTRQDMADYLGLTIETVSRTLSRFERSAIIVLQSARQIKLKDLPALDQLAT
jgi:CRP/FNR family nitrogen fixation transcriptional regulator